MPEMLIGWARLLEGRFRDARVGREVAIGAACGAVVALTAHVTSGLPTWMSIAGESTIPPDYDLVRGGIASLSGVFNALQAATFFALTFAGVLFLLRLLLRNAVAAIVGTTLVAMLLSLGGENALLEAPGAIVSGVILVACLRRAGLLALVALFVFALAMERVPLPLASSASYTATSIIVLAATILLALFAIRTSLGGSLRLGRGIAEELG
jgi:hypothetical protein